MSKLEPLNNNVVVKNREKEVKQGAIVIPDSAKEKSYEAVIVAVGAKAFRDNQTFGDVRVAVGDAVIYGKFSGSEVTVDGEKYLILKDTDILARIA